jgi:hypothetical protein
MRDLADELYLNGLIGADDRAAFAHAMTKQVAGQAAADCVEALGGLVATLTDANSAVAPPRTRVAEAEEALEEEQVQRKARATARK